LTPRPIRDVIRKQRTEIPFLIFITFFLTFSLVRVYTVLADVSSNPSIQSNFLGYRWHHYWWGILLLSVAGWMAINNRHKNVVRTAAVLYGVGLGYLLDEAGLLLTDDYHAMSTFSFVAGVSLLMMSLIFFPWFWRALKAELSSKRKTLIPVEEEMLRFRYMIRTRRLAISRRLLSPLKDSDLELLRRDRQKLLHLDKDIAGLMKKIREV